MLNKTLQKLQEKLGKAALPFLLFLFFIIICGVTFSSVKQKANDFREGQVAEESIRANKTIENTEETEQKENWQQKQSLQNTLTKKILQMTRTIGSSNYLN